MSVDIKAVDPAIVGAKTEAKEVRPRQVPVRAQAAFPLSTRLVNKNEDNTFDPAVDFTSTVVVQCADGKFSSLPRAVAAIAPLDLSGQAEEPVVFPFSSGVLASIVHWCEKYGKGGSSESKFTLPVLHTDFTTLLVSEWDKNFYSAVVNRHDGSDVFLGSINAAEKLGMNGLLDFLVVALGCAIRGKSDAEILSVLQQKAIPDEEIAKVGETYKWFAAATAPKSI
jgi:hypothetical protein